MTTAIIGAGRGAGT